MARIKIADLPKSMKISRKELKTVRGGAYEPYLSLGDTRIMHKLVEPTRSLLDGSTMKW